MAAQPPATLGDRLVPALFSWGFLLLGAAAVAGLLVLPFALPAEDVVGAAARRRDSLLMVGVLMLLAAGPLALVGVALTWAYLRWPRTLTRRSYYVVRFLVLVANGVVLMTGAWTDALTRSNPFGVYGGFWPKGVLLCSAFILIAPIVAGERLRHAERRYLR